MRLEKNLRCRQCRRSTLHAREVFSAGKLVMGAVAAMVWLGSAGCLPDPPPGGQQASEAEQPLALAVSEPPCCGIRRTNDNEFGPDSWRVDGPDSPLLVPLWPSLEAIMADHDRRQEEAGRVLTAAGEIGFDRASDRSRQRRNAFRERQLRRGEFRLVAPQAVYHEDSHGTDYYQVRLDDTAFGPPRLGWVEEWDFSFHPPANPDRPRSEPIREVPSGGP